MLPVCVDNVAGGCTSATATATSTTLRSGGGNRRTQYIFLIVSPSPPLFIYLYIMKYGERRRLITYYFLFLFIYIMHIIYTYITPIFFYRYMSVRVLHPYRFRVRYYIVLRRDNNTCVCPFVVVLSMLTTVVEVLVSYVVFVYFQL